jgi:hypothetical protein
MYTTYMYSTSITPTTTRERAFSVGDSSISIIPYPEPGDEGHDLIVNPLPETVGQWVLMPKNHILVCKGDAVYVKTKMGYI